MKNIAGKKILILATNGFEQSELEMPRDRLKAAGATVDIVSPEPGQIRGWEKKDWGRLVKVDKVLGDVSADEYDAIVLPGGQMNPDTLRINKDALALIRAFYDQKKIVAAVSGNSAVFPDFVSGRDLFRKVVPTFRDRAGGHSIVKVPGRMAAGSRSPRSAKAVTILRLGSVKSPSGIMSPSGGGRPSSSANSRRAAASGVSPASISPLGIDHTPASFFAQKGPPGWSSSTSGSVPERRWRAMPADLAELDLKPEAL